MPASPHAQLGRHADAVADYTAVLEREPGNTTAYFNRAAAYDALGFFDEAVRDYKRAMECDGQGR